MRTILSHLRTKTWLTFAVTWAGLALMSGAWALATPLGGSPDEPAHIIKAASVARGEFLGEPTDQAAVTRVRVPADLADAHKWTCYAFNDNVQASCMAAPRNGGKLETATTTAGLYNPVYYLLVGWPSLLTDSAKLTVFSMRSISAVISSFFLAVTLCGLLMFRRPLIAGVGFLATATPMVFFLNGAVNPNSLEISAGSALLTALLVLVRGPAVRHRYLALAVVGLSGVLLANARGISPLWMALIAVVAIIAADRGRIANLLRRVSVWVTIMVLAASVGFAGWWLLHTDTLGSMGTFPGAGQTSPQTAFATMFLDRSFDPGLIGYFGWLDTAAPGFAYALWSCLAFAVVGTCFVVSRHRLLCSVIVAVAGFMILPALMQAASIKSSGYIWQGRYTLVVYAVVVLMATVAVSCALPRMRSFPARWATRLFALLCVGVGLGQSFSLLETIRRYAVGEQGTWAMLIRHPLWAPPGGVLLWPLVLLVGFAFFVIVWAAWTRSRELPDGEDHRGGPAGSRPGYSLPGLSPS